MLPFSYYSISLQYFIIFSSFTGLFIFIFTSHPIFLKMFPFFFSFLLSFSYIHFLLCESPLILFSSLPLFYHSAVFTLIHYHFFCQLALTVLSFVRSHQQGPLGDKEMTEGGLYLPLWPLPCRLLNHVANRQHCLPARPRPDNGEPHSYLIQWSV